MPTSTQYMHYEHGLPLPLWDTVHMFIAFSDQPLAEASPSGEFKS